MSSVMPTDGGSLLEETTIADLILWHDLHRLQERCQDVSTRSAGWSALVDANLPAAAKAERTDR